MKKILVLILFTVISAHAQHEVINLPIGYDSIYFSNKESIAISNDGTGDLLIFVEDQNKSIAILFDKDFGIRSEIILESLPRTFKDFIGHQINSDNSYSIFFTNKNKKKYGELHLDFNAKTAAVNELDFKFKGETYVEAITVKGNFYMFSAVKNANTINFYTFKDTNFKKKKALSFDFLEGKSLNGFTKKAYHHLVSKNFGSTGSLTKIDHEVPNTIDITSKPNKLYVVSDTLIFTFDHRQEATDIAKITLPDLNFETAIFKQMEIAQKEFTNHNSYLFDNKLFQIKVSAYEMKFGVKDFNTKAILKEIFLQKDDSITFKNTPIIQKGPGWLLPGATQTRKLEATSKFLRKVSKGKTGISVTKQDTNYKITLGSEVEIARGAGGFGAMPGFGGVPIASFGAISMSFNPTFFAYGGYSDSKSTHIDCLFDENFQHIQGKVKDNIFDNIKTYEDDLSKSNSKKITVEGDIYDDDFNDSDFKNTPKLKNVFKHNNTLYLSFVGAQDKSLHIVAF